MTSRSKRSNKQYPLMSYYALETGKADVSGPIFSYLSSSIYSLLLPAEGLTRDQDHTVTQLVPGGSFGVVELTNREKEVLVMICKEYTAQEIADILFISKRTVDGHRNNLLSKLGCKNVVGLVIYALRSGLVNIAG